MELALVTEQINALKSELDSLRPFSEETEARIWQKLRLEWNFHSNNLEGNSLSFGETKNLLLFGNTTDGKPLKDHYHITGHNEAIEEVMDVVKRKQPLTEVFIRQLDEVILKESYKKDSIDGDGITKKRTIHIGEYKRHPNHVKTVTGEIFYFATPEETPAKMQELVDWFRSAVEDTSYHALLLAAELHYRFVRIHPFDDDDGRLSRLLMNFALMSRDLPPVIVKTQDKENYFRAFQKADSGDLEGFVSYIGEQLTSSLEIFLKGAKGEEIGEDDDLDKRFKYLIAKLSNSKEFELPIFKSSKTVLEFFENYIYLFLDRFLEESKNLRLFYNSFTIDLDLADMPPSRNGTSQTFSDISLLISSTAKHVKKCTNVEFVCFDFMFKEYSFSKHNVANTSIYICFTFEDRHVLLDIDGNMICLDYDADFDLKKISSFINKAINDRLVRIDKQTL